MNNTNCQGANHEVAVNALKMAGNIVQLVSYAQIKEKYGEKAEFYKSGR